MIRRRLEGAAIDWAWRVGHRLEHLPGDGRLVLELSYLGYMLRVWGSARFLRRVARDNPNLTVIGVQ